MEKCEFEKELLNNVCRYGKSDKRFPTYEHDVLVKQFENWQPKQLKPIIVVPSYVAMWFEKNIDSLGLMLYTVCKKIGDGNSELNDFELWFCEDRDRGFETIIRMKIDDYTIERPRYEIYSVRN